MPRLVVLNAVGTPDFPADLRRAWDAGDVVLPLDPRLPTPARRRLVEQAVGSGDALETGDALVVATSGSTGEPKLVVHTFAGLSAHASAVHQRLGFDRSRDRWLACLPLAHMGGLGVVARSLIDDVPLELATGPDPASLAAGLARGATLTSLVPTAIDRIDPTPWRRILLGGSADATTRPANVVRTYGSTESGGGVVYGGRPLDGFEVAVGMDGRIRLRGPSLARGVHDPATGALRPVGDPEGWLDTGDIGTWDGDRLVVLGRADDLIISGGENVWPGPVEDRLRSHPAVAEVAVVGRPDPEWGQIVVALVVARSGLRPSLDSLRAHVREAMPAHAAPRAVEIVESLPRTALGKLRRTEISDPGAPATPDV